MQQNKTREIEVTDSIIDTIIDKFITRAKFGKNKYGTDLSVEEFHDGILYLGKLKQTLSDK